jgi:hypothetical protein
MTAVKECQARFGHIDSANAVVGYARNECVDAVGVNNSSKIAWVRAWMRSLDSSSLSTTATGP